MINKLVKKNGQPLRILILVANDIVCDGRVKKEAKALIQQGARVTIIGQSQNPSKTKKLLENEEFDSLILKAELGVKQPRLGKEDVPKIVRIPVNLTITKFRELVYLYKKNNVRQSFEYANINPNVHLSEEAFDVIQANDVYTLKDGWELSQKFQAAFVVDSYELFDGYFTSSSMQKTSNQRESEYLPKAQHVFVVTSEIEKYIRKKYALSNTSVLLNSPYFTETELTQVHCPVRILDQCFLREAAGNMIALEAMQYLGNRATLTFQGRAHDPEYLKKLRARTEELGLSHQVTFAGEYDAKDAVKLANNFDIGLILHRPINQSKDFALANRLFTYQMAGVAVVASDTHAHRNFKDFETFGTLVPFAKEASPKADALDGKNLARALLRLIDNREQLEKMKKSSITHAKEYSFDEQGEAYCEAIFETYKKISGEDG